MLDKRRNRNRRSGRRMTRLAVVVLAAVLLLALALAVAHTSGPRGTTPIGYNQFEFDAKNGVYWKAYVDGNIFYLRKNDDRDKLYHCVVPDPGSAVGLLTKKGTLVSAYRVQPASGLSPAVLLALVIPYLVIGAVVLAMIQAAREAPVLGAPEDDELALPSMDCPGCGKTVQNPDEFCPHCAHRLQWSGKQLRCGACGEEVWPKDKFCRSCGASASEARSIVESPA